MFKPRNNNNNNNNGTSSDQLPVSCSIPKGSSAGPVEFIAYTEDVNRHGVQHHLYADDKQAYVNTPVSDVPAARTILEGCISDVRDWCSSRRLQLNETKTELIWFVSKKILGKVPETELNVTVDPPLFSQSSRSAILSHWTLSFIVSTHVQGRQTSSCLYQMRRLRQIRRLVGQEVTAQLVSEFILSQLDYCNSVLASLPQCSVPSNHSSMF